MDSFSPPEHDGTATGNVDEETAPRPGVLGFLAAAAGIVSGLFGLVYGVQLILFINWYTSAGYVPYVLLLVGTGVMVTAALSTRMRPVAAFAYAGLAGLQVLLAIGWTVYVVLIPLVTALGMLWPLAALATLALAPFTIPTALRAASFRKRLLEL